MVAMDTFLNDEFLVIVLSFFFFFLVLGCFIDTEVVSSPYDVASVVYILMFVRDSNTFEYHFTAGIIANICSRRCSLVYVRWHCAVSLQSDEEQVCSKHPYFGALDNHNIGALQCASCPFESCVA